MIRRRYIDAATGQLHLRENAAAPGTPLACLHATAYSSRSFIPLLTALDGRRHALAIDTPGYGESDAPSQPLTIAGYASAIASALPDRVDLFGYHTGAAIAVELAIAHPDRVGRLTMMGVPLFQALDFEAWRARLAARHHLGPDLDQFAERWDFLVTNRRSILPASASPARSSRFPTAPSIRAGAIPAIRKTGAASVFRVSGLARIVVMPRAAVPRPSSTA